MDRYRKLKVIGKGSFGYAVQVQSVADRHTYVMKVGDHQHLIAAQLTVSFCFDRSLTCPRWTGSRERTPSMR